MKAPWPGPLGPPPDLPAVIAVLMALVLMGLGLMTPLRRLPEAFFGARRRLGLALLSLTAAALSAGYVAHYLRGGPRVIDATSYWLQAKALAEGYLTWPIHEPTASVRGRFLLTSGSFEAPRLGVIFPPGYAVVLALGFMLGHPLWVGPFIAALLVIATHSLAKSVTGRGDAALLAASLSVCCAALRYHTADTMSHGWAALLVTSMLVFAYQSLDAKDPRWRIAHAAFAGVAWAWLFATRPVSALALAPVLAWTAKDLPRALRLSLIAASLLPLALFFLEQRAVTGSFLRSSQTAYYALADGPPGCFRYGLGEGIGCLHEHGEYVASVLPHGLTWGAAAITTLRRLRLHLIDIANAEPLVLLVLAAPLLAVRRPRDGAGRCGITARRILTLSLAPLLAILAYSPFYFDGSYPGGGARFFADVLPIEHVLIAASLALLMGPKGASDATRSRFDLGAAAAIVVAISLAGFGAHAVFEHLSLRDREGGRPFFEPLVLAEANIDRGLVFVGTDHAFNLAYDPGSNDARRNVVVSREYGDDRDRLVWESQGRPPTYRYAFYGQASASPAIERWSPPERLARSYRYEAEAEWPAWEQSGGFFEPVFANGTCASGGRLLAVRVTPGQAFRGTISFPVPGVGSFDVTVRLASRGDIRAQLAIPGGTVPLATWTYEAHEKTLACAILPERIVNLANRGALEVSTEGPGELWVDAVTVEANDPNRGLAPAN